MLATHCFGGIKAVLFDCDGTLVDSEQAHYLAWQKALQDLGSDLTLEDYYQYVGNPAVVNAKLLVDRRGMDCADRLLSLKSVYYKELCHTGIPPIAPTVAFLQKLAAEKERLGIKLGVCSASRKEHILLHLRQLEIESLFDIVLSGQEDLQDYSDPEGVNKPKPYIYQHAMKLLGTIPDETVVIEDSALGAWAGVSAGCYTVAVPNDYTKHHDFSHTHLQLESFSEMNVEEFLFKSARGPQIRKATPPDLARINAIMRASKGYWGYDASFMDRFMERFGVTEVYMQKNTVYVLIQGSETLGFFSFAFQADHSLELDYFFIDPAYIGQGYGKQMWQSCVAVARDLGAKEFTLWADPNTEGFYAKMGCEKIGERPSPFMPNRNPPVMRYRL